MSFLLHPGDWPRLITCDHCPTHTIAATRQDATNFTRQHNNIECRTNRNRTAYKERT